MKRVWIIGLPAFLVVGVVGVFLWGSLQPKPQGYAPVDRAQIVEASPALAAVIEDAEPVPIETIRYTLDATSMEEWVLFDFTEGRVVDSDFSLPGWDLAFRRTKLLTNSGVTNPSGPGGAANVGEISLDDVILPMSVVFDVDILGGEDADEPENPAVGRWYSYSFITHIVTPKPNTYLVRTGEDLDALVQFDSYYCEDEESGCITLRYRLVPRSTADES
jgi:hypothetical protein